MVRTNSRGRIGHQVSPAQIRGVAIDGRSASLGCENLVENLQVACQHGGEVHHFRQSEHSPVLKQLGDFHRTEHCAGAFPSGRRHAGRRHEVEVQRQPLAGGQQHLDAAHPQHVADLVWITHDRGGAMRNHQPSQLGGRSSVLSRCI